MRLMRKKSDVIDLVSHRAVSKQQLLEQLFREHGTSLRAFLTSVMGSSHELDDIIQEIFAKLAKEDDLIARLPTDRGKWCSYLFAMANNLVVDLARYKQVRQRFLKKEQHQLTEESAIEHASPERLALNREELERVKDVILGLRPRWRQAFIQNRFKHKSYRQIADDMGVSVKQVEKYMKQALIRIRESAEYAQDESGEKGS
ncbi:sigma-70 family RNA polymerase sigma factor [Porticoccaceae bacterium LTM1]|nr:sigma-70 family RNA polymerase sigma factor [Porticoccaceae bacterium LTM1]